MNVSDYITEWTEWAEVSSHCSVTVDSMIESLLGQSCSNTSSINIIITPYQSLYTTYCYAYQFGPLKKNNVKLSDWFD